MERQTNDLTKKLEVCDFKSDSISVVRDKNIRQVFFDVETSGLSYKYHEILQIAAKSSELSFNVYVTPTKPISSSASEVNHLTFSNGNLMYNENIVHSIPIAQALKDFKDFLSKVPQPCLLVAHNAKFDSSFLLTAVMEHDLLEDFEKVVCGFVDTLKVFMDILPDRKGQGMFKLEALAKDFLPRDRLESDGTLHDAAYDVLILEKLFLSSHFEKYNLPKYSVSFREECERIQKNARIAEWEQLLMPLEGEISEYMIKKLASKDISIKKLSSVFKDKGEQGFVEFLAGPDNEGKVFITKDKKVIGKLINVLKEFLEYN